MLISAHGSLVPRLFFCRDAEPGKKAYSIFMWFQNNELARDIELQRELKGPSKLREICVSVSVSMR